MKKDIFGGFPGGRFIGKEELDAVKKVIKARSPYRFYGLNLQKKTETLERLCRSIFKRKYALTLSSGTAALHTALFSLGVSKNDEVILPAYGWIANLMAVLSLDAVPGVVPVDEALGLDPSRLKKSITKKTKVIVAVHMRGYPCDLKNIVKIGHRHGVKVIEDGAQCIGGKIDKRPIGTLGDISILSVQYNKLVTCGEGGILLTNDKRLYDKAYRFHDLGMSRSPGKADPEGLSSISSFGLNYRLSELQAAFLIPQIRKMPVILKSLKSSYKLAFNTLDPICKKFGLAVRKSPFNSEPNHAFLCLNARTEHDADKAWRALRRLGVPAQKSSRLDGHHFKVWERYMSREKRPFKLKDRNRSVKVLKKSIFIEINPLPKRS